MLISSKLNGRKNASISPNENEYFMADCNNNNKKKIQHETLSGCMRNLFISVFVLVQTVVNNHCNCFMRYYEPLYNNIYWGNPWTWNKNIFDIPMKMFKTKKKPCRSLWQFVGIQKSTDPRPNSYIYFCTVKGDWIKSNLLH